MKKRNVRTLDGIIYSLFIFMTLSILFIIYRDIPSRAVLNFVTAYAIFIMLIPLYILIRVLFTVKHFTFDEVKKEGIKFLVFFAGVAALNFIYNFLLELPTLKFSKMLPSSLGFSFGITCFDIVLSKRAK